MSPFEPIKIGEVTLEDCIKELPRIKKDLVWLDNNRQKVIRNYKNEFVAIKDGNVLDHDKSSKVLFSKLRKSGENPSILLIEFIKDQNILQNHSLFSR